ncbi:MAG: hypothetical protein WBL67_17830 [Nitrososphaeraceae archaeon]
MFILLGDAGVWLVVIAVLIIIANNKKSVVVGAVAPSAPSTDQTLANRLWTAIGDPSPARFQKQGLVTVTGTVVGKQPHYNTVSST